MGEPITVLNRRSWLRTAGVAALSAGLGRSVRAQGPAEHLPPAPEGDLINLAGNENPFGPSPSVVRAIVAGAPQACRYPFREEQALKEKLAEKEGVGTGNILLGNGCDELLALAGAAFLKSGKALVSAEPTYFQLIDYARRLGADMRGVPVGRGMQHDLPAMARAVDDRAGLVYLCNPDNPSGTVRPGAEVTDFLREVSPRVPVFVDEVYLELMADFPARTQVPLVKEGLPVIIGRSFSKMYGLAGQRIGYAVTTSALVAELGQWQMSSVNYLGVAAARAALQDSEFPAWSIRKIQAGKARFYELLRELKQEYIPSEGNFVYHRIGPWSVQDYQAVMKTKGLLVGWPHAPAPGYEAWCRTSIGTDAEMRICAQAMRAVLG